MQGDRNWLYFSFGNVDFLSKNRGIPDGIIKGLSGAWKGCGESKMISIIMLTYNAPKLVEHSIVTLRKYTKGVPFELIVLDNHSKRRTRKLLLKLQERGYINKIIFEDHNTLFAKESARLLWDGC